MRWYANVAPWSRVTARVMSLQPVTGFDPGCRGCVPMRSATLTGDVQLATVRQSAEPGHFTITIWLIPTPGVFVFPKNTYSVPSGPTSGQDPWLSLQGPATGDVQMARFEPSISMPGDQVAPPSVDCEK